MLAALAFRAWSRDVRYDYDDGIDGFSNCGLDSLNLSMRLIYAAIQDIASETSQNGSELVRVSFFSSLHHNRTSCVFMMITIHSRHLIYYYLRLIPTD
jgi:hypothetical protein